MNHSKFNFYDAFCFDDNILMFAFLVSMIMVAEEELNHQGRRTESRNSVQVTISSIIIEREMN
jgi:hypothetical protein